MLRTLPEAPADAVRVLRRSAHALGIEWAHPMSYAELIRSLDSSDPHHAAFLEDATSLLRGAGYTAFDGELPELATHAAVAAEYAHATAPLRRLVDRYVSEVCLSLCAGETVPGVGAGCAAGAAGRDGGQRAPGRCPGARVPRADGGRRARGLRSGRSSTPWWST